MYGYSVELGTLGMLVTRQARLHQAIDLFTCRTAKAACLYMLKHTRNIIFIAFQRQAPVHVVSRRYSSYLLITLSDYDIVYVLHLHRYLAGIESQCKPTPDMSCTLLYPTCCNFAFISVVVSLQQLMPNF
jgi:hypothetical protein